MRFSFTIEDLTQHGTNLYCNHRLEVKRVVHSPLARQRSDENFANEDRENGKKLDDLCGYLQESKMAVRIVRLGSPRAKNEGVRIGTVRRPPRGVPKTQFASQNWYDVWFPNLAPSADIIKLAQNATTKQQWNAFVKKYRAEMATPANQRTLDVLAALSHQTNFAVGCYCEDEAHCHRSILRELLREHGAQIA